MTNITIKRPFKAKDILLGGVNAILAKESLISLEVKYDGICVYKSNDVFYSRTGKLLNKVDMSKFDNVPNDVWGELFVSTSDKPYGDIGRVINTVKGDGDQSLLKFYPFDSKHLGGDLHNQFDNVTKINGEGLILKTSGKKGLVKYYKIKPRQDSEFEVVEFLEGTGKYTGMLASLVCKVPSSDKTFNCGVGGTNSERIALWKKYEGITGKVATIEFESLLASGVPKFGGTLKAIRDYE